MAEEDLRGLPSPCQAPVKEVCLTFYRYLPIFWSHTWSTPFCHWAQRQPGKHSLKKDRSDFCKDFGSQENTGSLGLWACVFCLPTPNALNRSDVLLRAQWRFSAVFCGGEHCQKVLEDALAAHASTDEVLLLSAGRCGQSPGKRPYRGKSWVRFGLRTPTLRAACTKEDIWVESPPIYHCQKWAPIKGCWCGSSQASSTGHLSSPLMQHSTSCRSWLPHIALMHYPLSSQPVT